MPDSKISCVSREQQNSDQMRQVGGSESTGEQNIKRSNSMGKNFRETLSEQLKDPEFKKVWDEDVAERDRIRSLLFESSLTLEEIEQNFADVDVFSGIMDGLNEALANEKRIHLDGEKKESEDNL